MSASQNRTALNSLEGILANNQILTNPVELLAYEGDASLDCGEPDGVVFAHTAGDVAHIVRWASAHHVPLIARGAGTGLSGGAVAERGGVIVEFSRMNRVLEFDEMGRSVVVQPGVVNLALDEFVKAKGLYFPPDPASGRTATIGGNIAENAGGPHCFKYGVTTNYITGLQVILADGRMIRLGGRALDYPEFDLLGLVTGSEGTLALVTEASARLLRNPLAIKTMMASFDSVEAAGKAVSAVIARGLVPATMEMMDQKMMQIIEDYVHVGLPIHAGAALIIEADGYPESVIAQIEEIAATLREHNARDMRIAQTAEERDRIWYGRKSAAGAMARLSPAYYLLDGTVPRSKLAQTLAGINQLCEGNSLRVGYVFHAGDGNLHPFILIPDPNDPGLMQRVLDAGKKIMQLCVNMGGSITGEHGVGVEKRDFMPLMYTAGEIVAMRDLREVLDPKNILNPGKIFPAEGPRSAPRSVSGAPPASPFAPTSAEQASDAIRAWRATGKRIHIRGNGTAPTDGAVLSTQALRGIHTYSLDDLYVTVGAGTTLAELQTELAHDRMWVPLVSPWKEATVGSIIATNFNAPLRMRYGGVRDLLLATKVVLPDGSVIWAGRPVVKNVAGYDMPKLFVGSYGTLGLIVDATFKLSPLPRARKSLVVPLHDLQHALVLGTQLLRVCLVASGLLLCYGCNIPGTSAPFALIYTAEGLPEDVTAELSQVRDVLQRVERTDLAQLDTLSANTVWANWLSLKSEGVVVRAGVAPKDLANLLIELGPKLGSASFIADIANGMLYVRGASAAPVWQAAQALGGYAIPLHTSSGQLNGVWGYAPESLDLMRAIKARWDPQCLFNPGAFIV